MNRRAAILSLISAGAGSYLRAASGSPQETASSHLPQNSRPQEEGTFRSDVRLVLLDVSVKDSKGGFVSGLSKDDFSVFENGVRQQISVFAHDDVPVTIGILVDSSRSMIPKYHQVITAATTFIEQSNPQDEIFVLHFNDDVKLGLPPGVPFSDDIQQLRTALYNVVPDGKTALNDGIVEGLLHLEQGRKDKKALILISDGGDNASRHTRRDTILAVENSIATIYAIGVYDPDDLDRDPGILRQLARISGGEAFAPIEPADLVPVCKRIAKDIRTRYTIGYLPSTSGESVRHVRVRAASPSRSSLVVRTRDMYRYDVTQNAQKQ